MALMATPKSLAEVWSLNPGAFLEGQRAYEQAQAYDNQTMTNRASEEAYKGLERPQKLEELMSMNANRRAETPGIKARSTVASNAADFDNATYDQRMESWAAENKGKITKVDFDEFQRAGPIMQQLAEQAAYNPSPGINKAIREQMTRMGVGGMWNPEWDNADPQTLSAGLYDFGSAMNNALPSIQKMREQLESKEQIAAAKNETSLKLQEMRGNISRQLAAARKSASAGGSGGGVKKLEQLAATLRQSALIATDTDAKQMYLDSYQEVMDEMWKLRNKETTPKNILNPDTGKIELTQPAQSPFKKGTSSNTPKTGDKLPDGSIYISKD